MAGKQKPPLSSTGTVLCAWVDGQPSTAVPVTDRGFLYGDGIFETMRLCRGRLPLWPWHQRRLKESCRRLGLSFDVATLERQLFSFIKENDCNQSVIKVLLTRGDGGQGYNPSGACGRQVISLHDLPEPLSPERFAQGVSVVYCHTRLGHCPVLAGMKHMCRLEQVLARAEWHDSVHFEGLVFDIKDRLIEGTMSNLFLATEGALVTPDLSQCGVRGVMRQWILEQIPVREAQLTRQDLEKADEVFLVNSIRGVVPVGCCEDNHWTVGPFARRIQKKWDALFVA